MTRLQLKLHPDSSCSAVRRIEVDVFDDGDHLVLCFGVSGNIPDVLVPARSPSMRGCELWRHTCFEAFIHPLPGAEYREFNFAPSTKWAAYRFESYRSGKQDIFENGTIPIEIHADLETFQLRALLSWGCLTKQAQLSRLGLSALIEETSGQKSYWALAHPPGKPDFHHPDCFIHEFSLKGHL